MALNLGEDWRRLLSLQGEDLWIAQLVVKEAQRLHVLELQAVADRTAAQTANHLGPMLGKLISSLAKAMR